MGSLMAGWNSPRTKKRFERNLSLTKEEIDSYWRVKKADQSSPQARTPNVPALNLAKKTIQKSSTFSSQDDDHMASECARILQLSPHKEVLKSKTFNGREAEAEVHSELLVGSAPAAWWTKTDLAFLNERPVLESVVGRASQFKYESQFKVTEALKTDDQSHRSASSSTFVF
ncbi:hypothetical protein SELMODRAFT_447777 [Selaginella moellendorffii]|uniref:Uncharacterized protein n=1 Tax=Selaginella moellendorffii TaxID=88036 RepID=D8T287_SELML|nr:uncharacterized protein LOC9637650 [Selaginella moellendorffii]EFJ09219.1 hypothetical protein SELMODRAFT_447777 [Selaginella moellendorffii]|eukprot:XP_002989742.1 uncharacterized protein LOC9637650 [Selaginella moellendorffii]